MTDPTSTENPVEELPEPEIETPFPEPAPEPARSVFVQMQFTADGASEGTYASTIQLLPGQTSETYARQVAEIIERTGLLHFGALPVLKKLEAGA